MGSIFQSTPRKRGATCGEEFTATNICNFNPRPASAGRRGGNGEILRCNIFQSTPRKRGATRSGHNDYHPARISIHAPQARGDNVAEENIPIIGISIHAPQARGDLFKAFLIFDIVISIHAPQARGDSTTRTNRRFGGNFNPRPASAGRHHRP